LFFDFYNNDEAGVNPKRGSSLVWNATGFCFCASGNELLWSFLLLVH
jgi:hypothetical protein